MFKKNPYPCIEQLISALQYIDDNISCDIINLSMTISCIDEIDKLKQLEVICNKLVEKNIIIISAFDNSGAMSYPAVFDSVVGVTTGESCKTINDIEYVEDSDVNICGFGSQQRVISNGGNYVIQEGNSLACAHISGILSNFIITNHSLKQIKNIMCELSIKNHNHRKSKSVQKENPVKEYKKCILFPFNKEIHSLIRYSKLLEFDVEHVFDLKYSGLVGTKVSKFLNEVLPKDYIIEDINELNIDTFDTLILGHVTDLCTNKKIKKIIETLIMKCDKNGKNIFTFDEFQEITTYSLEKAKSYCPNLDSNNRIYAPFGKLYEISKPVVGIWGTDSKQGKFTLQLALRESLLERGYNVGQIGSEPSALLFGIDACFPFGYNTKNIINRYDTITYLNMKLHEISNRDKDLIIVGCQSRSVTENTGNLDHYSIPQIEFLLGTQPDIVILTVFADDEIEYVQRTILFLENCVNCKVISVVIFPIKRIRDENNIVEKMYLDKVESINSKNEMENILGIKVYCLGIQSDIEVLTDEIVEYFS